MTHEDLKELGEFKVDMKHFWFLVYLYEGSPPRYAEEAKQDALVARDKIIAKFEELLESRADYREMWTALCDVGT